MTASSAGDPVAVVLPRELFDRIRGVLLLDTASELLVARAQKFLDRAGRPDLDPPVSSTALGGWYANV